MLIYSTQFGSAQNFSFLEKKLIFNLDGLDGLDNREDDKPEALTTEEDKYLKKIHGFSGELSSEEQQRALAFVKNREKDMEELEENEAKIIANLTPMLTKLVALKNPNMIFVKNSDITELFHELRNIILERNEKLGIAPQDLEEQIKDVLAEKIIEDIRKFEKMSKRLNLEKSDANDWFSRIRLLGSIESNIVFKHFLQKISKHERLNDAEIKAIQELIQNNENYREIVVNVVQELMKENEMRYDMFSIFYEIPLSEDQKDGFYSLYKEGYAKDLIVSLLAENKYTPILENLREATNLSFSEINALGKLGSTDSDVQKLLPYLKHEAEYMVGITLHALGNLKNPEAISAIEPFLDSEEYFESAVEALKRIGTEQSVSVLFSVLKKDNLKNYKIRSIKNALRYIGIPIPDLDIKTITRMFGNSYGVLTNTIENNADFQEWLNNFYDIKSDKNSPIIQNIFKKFNFEKITDEERLRNVKSVNNKQKRYLDANKIEHSREITEGKRSLVLYCRHDQINAIDFAIFAKTANDYINSGYSKVFTDVKIVSRQPNKYYKSVIPENIEYENVEYEDFREAMAIGGNAVHFTHGLPQENDYGSTPVLSAAVRGDPGKMKYVLDYISMRLKTDPRKEVQVPKNEELFDGDMMAMAEEFIRAIRELEEKLLEEVS